MRILTLGLLLPVMASAHYMWIARSHCTAVITFSETPSHPGMKSFLANVAKRTTAKLGVQPAQEVTPLSLKLASLARGSGELTAALPPSVNTSAVLLEGSALWGLFRESGQHTPLLLQYWFSAHHFADGWSYWDALSTNRLSVTLHAAASPAGHATAKVAVVTKFDGKKLGNVVVELFDETGAARGSVTTSPDGVAMVELPAGRPAFAMTSHREHAPGIDPVSGKPYETILHYATHSMLVDGVSAAPPRSQLSSQTPEALAETARWIVAHGNWGYVTTFASPKQGSAASTLKASVLSFSDGASLSLSTGRLFFFVMGGELGEGGGQSAALTISQAALNHTTSCEAQQLDPEDPRCAKLTISGTLTAATGDAEALGRACLFARHPQMAHWPPGHRFQVCELKIDDIWLIDFYGGAGAIAPPLYFKVKPRHHVPSWPPSLVEPEPSLIPAFPWEPRPPVVTRRRSGAPGGGAADPRSPPAGSEAAKRARWLVYHAVWASLGTVSVRLKGRPWGNVRSVADGVGANSTGLPVLYLPTPDPTAADIEADARATLSLSEASLRERVTPAGLLCGGRDPEDPTCARLHLSGTLRRLSDAGEVARAEESLGARHPFAPWLAQGGAHTGGDYFTIELESLVFFDNYGGPAELSVEDYLAAPSPGV